jgi:hypothetical protein
MRSGTLRVTRRHQAPTLAGPSHHDRYRHAQTHRHIDGTVISRYRAARSGKARVTAAVRLDTCSLP